jgi:type I restriction-modification system DNA methylase subunit
MKGHVNDDEKYPKQIVDVLAYINTHLAPKDTERHKFGEVFTPMSLVHEMLDTLPEEVWTNKNLTWLDPANGMGNFPIAAFLRLFMGLEQKMASLLELQKKVMGNTILA